MGVERDPMSRMARTTAFRLDRETCGQVWLWRADHEGAKLWREAEAAWRAAEASRARAHQLPHQSLGLALTALSGDFVHTLPRLQVEDGALFVSQRALDLEQVSRALWLWGSRVLGVGEALRPVARHLSAEPVELWDLWSPDREGAFPPEWWFKAARWGLAHRLAREPWVVAGREVQWRLDSQASLLAWETPFKNPGRSGEHGRAMHRLLIDILSVPGCPGPVVSLVPVFSRLELKIGGWIRNVWADLGRDLPILRARLTHRKTDTGWEADWEDGAHRILEHLIPTPLPRLDDEALLVGDRLRASPKRPPAYVALGRGPGPQLFEAVAHHARQRLEGLEPIVLHRPCNLPKRSSAAPTPQAMERALAQVGGRARIVAVYDDPLTRRRMAAGVARLGSPLARERRALADALSALVDDSPLCLPGGLEVVFRRPPGAAVLRRYAREEEVSELIAPLLDQDEAPDRLLVCLVETLAASALQKRPPAGLVDPKPYLRQALARRGILCQFIASNSWSESGPLPTAGELIQELEKKPRLQGPRRRPPRPSPHEVARASLMWPAWQATLDLLRGAGIFPWPLAGDRLGFPPGTWLVGITGVRRQERHRRPGALDRCWALTWVAARVGDQTAFTWRPGRGWLPFAQGNADFLSTLDLLTDDDARDCMDTAIDDLLAIDKASIVVFVDGQACRRLWGALRERTRGERLPRVAQHRRVAVIRCRRGRAELPSVAGRGRWRDDGKYTRSTHFSGLYELIDASSRDCFYYLDTPRLLSLPGPHRDSTRFGQPPAGLKRDWHGYVTREIHIARSAGFDVLPLARLAALLHRAAVTWEGEGLARPAPLHLSWKMLDDHPQQPLSWQEPDEEELG